MEDKKGPIAVLYLVGDSWNIIGEETCMCWYEEDGDDFVDALLDLVMRRARARGRLL
jgi:hypothetical protein